MNATIAKELIEHVRVNINEDIPNVGVIKALLEDAISYLEYPIVPEKTELDGSNFDFTFLDFGKCAGKVCYCDGSCKSG